jgi:DhnA family fructose-bisphosphate aldolase class Ia
MDTDRNFFQGDMPLAILIAIRAVVHESMKSQLAYEQFVRQW